jgi:hypothetical protein
LKKNFKNYIEVILLNKLIKKLILLFGMHFV